MKSKTLVWAAALLVAVGALATRAGAAVIDTVNWTADSTVDGTGTGTLASGTKTVTYTTVATGNAGTTIPSPTEAWDTSPATKNVASGGVTNLSGGVLGTTGAANVQNITFSASITNPVLFVNFSDATSTMNFGTQSITLLSSNNAQLAGNIVSFVGSSNTGNDGFAARINGTFGPGVPVTFTYTTTAAFDSVGFTITPAPEPASLGLLGLGALGLLARRRFV